MVARGSVAIDPFTWPAEPREQHATFGPACLRSIH